MEKEKCTKDFHSCAASDIFSFVNFIFENLHTLCRRRCNAFPFHAFAQKTNEQWKGRGECERRGVNGEWNVWKLSGEWRRCGGVGNFIEFLLRVSVGGVSAFYLRMQTEATARMGCLHSVDWISSRCAQQINAPANLRRTKSPILIGSVGSWA